MLNDDSRKENKNPNGNLAVDPAFRISGFVIRSSFVIRIVILFRHGQTDRSVECFENRVWHKDIEEQLHIKHNDNASGRPA